MMKCTLSLIFSIFLLTFSVAQAQQTHTKFDQLLKKHVNRKGGVNYTTLKRESKTLDSYVASLSRNKPESSWSDDEVLTYWINVYNAVTLQLVLKYYPIKSIKDIGSTIKILGISTAWDLKHFKYEGKLISLNDIEHNIIRKKFNEPRIHFALVCAAVSCPKLRNEAYKVSILEYQLTDQTRSFLSNTGKNQVSGKYLEISSLFDWYGGDFSKSGTIPQFINKYTDVEVGNKAKISFMKYDWRLNEQ